MRGFGRPSPRAAQSTRQETRSGAGRPDPDRHRGLAFSLAQSQGRPVLLSPRTGCMTRRTKSLPGARLESGTSCERGTFLLHRAADPNTESLPPPPRRAHHCCDPAPPPPFGQRFPHRRGQTGRQCHVFSRRLSRLDSPNISSRRPVSTGEEETTCLVEAERTQLESRERQADDVHRIERRDRLNCTHLVVGVACSPGRFPTGSGAPRPPKHQRWSPP